ncbi:MAG: alpha/beta hydrolase, partial [Pseudomonadota bacterium]
QMFGLFSYFSDVSWMTDAHRMKYRQVWSQPGAMTAMLDWYRASPVWVPKPGESAEGRNNPFADRQKFRVEPRHLLIWGERDPSCRPTCHAGLSEYCRDLTKVLVPDADHWIVGAKPELIVREVEKFLQPIADQTRETA